MTQYFDSGWFRRNNVHPFFAVFIGCAICFGCLLAFQFLSVFFASLIFKIPAEDLILQGLSSGADENFINAQKFIQVVSTAGGFFGGVFLTARLCSKNTFSFLSLRTKVNPTMLLLCMLAMMAALPLILWLGYQNEHIHLPQWLKGLEDSMRRMESDLEGVVKKFMQADSVSAMALNVFILAMLPAMGEELFFRGFMQRTFFTFLNPHFAIFVTSVIFSAIHFQFLGFIPRLFIGMYLGYIAFWSRSLWLPIAAHFANNAFQLIGYYAYQKGVSNLDVDSDKKIPTQLVLGSLLISSLLIAFIYNHYRKSSRVLGIDKENWIKIFTVTNLFEAELMKGRLMDAGIAAVIITSRDRMNLVLSGSIGVYVQKENEIAATEIINQPANE